MAYVQLDLFPLKGAPIDWTKKSFPLRCVSMPTVCRIPHSQTSRFVYVLDEAGFHNHSGRGDYHFTPHLLRLSCWKENGILKFSPCGLPAHVRAARDALLAQHAKELDCKPMPKRQRETVAGYQWSLPAKSRNRRNRLRKRIEKKWGLVDGVLMGESLRQQVEHEYQAAVAKNTDYYAGLDVAKY